MMWVNWFRGVFLNALLKPIDFSLKWLHLRLEIQVLILERVALRFHIFKLRIERKHLLFLLDSKRDVLLSEKVGELPHEN